MTKRFEGKVALVTGGARGIGAATARLLREQGAIVAIADLPGAGGEAMASDIGAVFHALDVVQEDEWRRVLARLVADTGGLDVLVNAAGIVGDSVNGALDRISLAEWRRVLAVNLDGTFLGCREAVAHMREQGRGGAIVNLASVGAYYPTPQNVAYGASKAAVTNLTKSVALFAAEGGHRIRCNSVHPGMIETPMFKQIVSEISQRAIATASKGAQSSMERMPLGAPGKPEEVAAMIAFLASDEAAYVTGSEFTVDGGWRLLR
ncbi:3-beta-hydroxysteroid dehydrogenase [Variovorax sp. PBS-H4]|uniref:SDR family NAD(P)-dependent oxidoreductase n=1 Tax=Variovorax sp. PBS-H4 TaxID=434008 RepID=UPI001316ADF0|nr:SDR family oxidoreductase [Variovorax sp. PBS-H4]VTU29909.1 3-beta-hydroxysteroid dehydrogenase [Variovorax sp. PBS-H4]